VLAWLSAWSRQRTIKQLCVCACVLIISYVQRHRQLCCHLFRHSTFVAFANMCHITHTHPFNGPLSGTTRVSQYQKGKTNLNFTAARDSEWQWHQLGMCKSAPLSRQITTPAPHHSVFYRPDALSATQPTASKHWRLTCAIWMNILIIITICCHMRAYGQGYNFFYLWVGP